MGADPVRVAMLGLRAPWGPEGGVDGGVERVVAELAPRLAARGCQVTVYCRRRYNALGPGPHRGVELVDVGTVYTKHLEAFVHTAVAMPAAVRRADLVHIHAMGPALFSWMPRLVGRTTVVTIHGLDWQRVKWGPGARAALRLGEHAAATFPHGLITVSRDLAEHFRASYGVDATWIPNGVAPIPAVPLAESRQPGLVSGRFLLLLGRLVPEKGVEGLLAAYGEAAIPDPLLVVGGSAYTDQHVAHLHRIAPPGVRFTGPLHGRPRDALLTHARALILPSLVEGFPLTPLESLSAGRPVLLSDIAPHRELLAGVCAGWLVAPDQAAWVAALQRLVSQSDGTLSAMGSAGREHVRAHYSWDEIADRTLDAYRRAAGRARSAGWRIERAGWGCRSPRPASRDSRPR
ncbi:MAG: glycosyltransferase family 4 protein [Oligoflexia bacterium]|nr:glycosyltransferase family 4 protein [Oligoflexia bacterium]